MYQCSLGFIGFMELLRDYWGRHLDGGARLPMGVVFNLLIRDQGPLSRKARLQLCRAEREHNVETFSMEASWRYLS